MYGEHFVSCEILYKCIVTNIDGLPREEEDFFQGLIGLLLAGSTQLPMTFTSL